MEKEVMFKTIALFVMVFTSVYGFTRIWQSTNLTQKWSALKLILFSSAIALVSVALLVLFVLVF
jgi:hypothetical protein